MSAPDVARLLPTERQQRIRRLAAERGVLRVVDLAELFGVSEMTVRRDLEALAEEGLVERTFGGAVASAQTAFESSYRMRLRENAPQKRAIARYAATLVQDGDTVALDASTTSLALARELTRRPVTVVTNSLDSAQELRAGSPEVILIGGRLRRVAGSFAGPMALRALRDLRVDQAFVSAKGIAFPDGLMDSDLDEVEVKRAMIRSADRTTALLDASKFGTRALGRIGPLAEIALLVSDDALDDDARSALRDHEVAFHLVDVAP